MPAGSGISFREFLVIQGALSLVSGSLSFASTYALIQLGYISSPTNTLLITGAIAVFLWLTFTGIAFFFFYHRRRFT